MSLTTTILSRAPAVSRDAKQQPRTMREHERDSVVDVLDTGRRTDMSIWRIARQMRDEWRKRRYSRLAG